MSRWNGKIGRTTSLSGARARDRRAPTLGRHCHLNGVSTGRLGSASLIRGLHPPSAWSGDHHHQTKGADGVPHKAAKLKAQLLLNLPRHHCAGLARENTGLAKPPRGLPPAEHSAVVIPHSTQLLPRQHHERRGIGFSAHTTGTLETPKRHSCFHLPTTPTASTVYRLGGCPLDLNGRSADSNSSHPTFTEPHTR
ncbi:hypothetical protein SNOG_11623 [Parastagonospora nodorum SN15]|uniref:Uncharacterized protein n=1 Tax=Phaeosphaeria nodorum (strain SN15 / ATCC MYA-4574 / FGSC 10173) TaxID=321614 RepID=Q0U9E1_PHANO|nr:hypothetical protein SNOG_11623 [Parastagonospora nodorum SN15]EAT81331.1 hypothetical protein SNOG_11623 [Parastagonospora nodorum SN15]